jgi:hypothetical protein
MNRDDMEHGHPDPEQLASHAEGGTAGTETEALEAHLASCEPCREEVAWIRRLRGEAATLPTSIEPSHDLFPGIRERITKAGPTREEAPARTRWSASWLAAAAVILVALSSAVTLQLARDGAGGTVPPRTAGDPGVPGVVEPGAGAGPERFASAGEEAVWSVASAWAPTLRELESALDERRDRLQPETIDVIETNLRIIDEAIREAREALEADPANQGAARSLNGMYESRAQVLRQASLLTGA